MRRNLILNVSILIWPTLVRAKATAVIFSIGVNMEIIYNEIHGPTAIFRYRKHLPMGCVSLSERAIFLAKKMSIGLDSFCVSKDLDFLMRRSGLISRQQLVPLILNYDCIFSMQTHVGRELPANITFLKGFVAVIDRQDITGPLFSKSD